MKGICGANCNECELKDVRKQMVVHLEKNVS